MFPNKGGSLYLFFTLTVLSVLVGLKPTSGFAASKSTRASANSASCIAELTAKPSEAYARILAARGDSREHRVWTLDDFFNENPDDNFAVQHPFSIANAAEKSYALITHVAPVTVADPLFGVKKVKVYPLLAGHPLANFKMVIGNEEAVQKFVEFLGSEARGDRVGKALGFPGPAGTGKTELLYAYDALERNLGKLSRYRQYSYRWRVSSIPVLKNLYLFDRQTGQPTYEYIDPDMPRSPFTLLRADMQESILAKRLPQIRSKWDMTISRGWVEPEPLSRAIMRAIFEYEYPEIAQGLMTVDDLTPQEYLGTIKKYLVIVPKSQLVQPSSAAQIIRAQQADPNLDALFTSVNLRRHAYYNGTALEDLAFNNSGQVYKRDGSLLMMDEIYRNPESLLNILLEVKQNRIVQTDRGSAVTMDIVPIWNSNDESIEKASENMALKASIDRDQAVAMRSLLVPNQIEKTIVYIINNNSFEQRPYNGTELKPLDYNEVYPAPDKQGKTESAYGRYAVYYSNQKGRVLIAPLALNYMAWLATATRFESDPAKFMAKKDELNLVQSDPSFFTNPITRLKILLGDRDASAAERQELTRVWHLLEEGRKGISSRSLEPWIKQAINIALNDGTGTVTPKTVDRALEELLLSGEIKPSNDTVRAEWQILRGTVKSEILLPRLEKDVKAIISGDGDRANRIYDEIEREFLAQAESAAATEVTPDDGSQPVPINQIRLDKIKAIYRKRFNKDFSTNFLIKNLQLARRGQGKRDSALLEAVRDFLADQDALTNENVLLFDRYYRGESNNDPKLLERISTAESRLAAYGYDTASFREAVSFAAQLRAKKLKDSKNEGEQ